MINVNNNKLTEEKETYEKNKQNLIRDDKGKFVLIKGKKIIGIFKYKIEAVNAGNRKFGAFQSFVKEIKEED